MHLRGIIALSIFNLQVLYQPTVLTFDILGMRLNTKSYRFDL